MCACMVHGCLIASKLTKRRAFAECTTQRQRPYDGQRCLTCVFRFPLQPEKVQSTQAWAKGAAGKGRSVAVSAALPAPVLRSPSLLDPLAFVVHDVAHA